MGNEVMGKKEVKFFESKNPNAISDLSPTLKALLEKTSGRYGVEQPSLDITSDILNRQFQELEAKMKKYEALKNAEKLQAIKERIKLMVSFLESVKSKCSIPKPKGIPDLFFNGVVSGFFGYIISRLNSIESFENIDLGEILKSLKGFITEPISAIKNIVSQIFTDGITEKTAHFVGSNLGGLAVAKMFPFLSFIGRVGLERRPSLYDFGTPPKTGSRTVGLPQRRNDTEMPIRLSKTQLPELPKDNPYFSLSRASSSPRRLEEATVDGLTPGGVDLQHLSGAVAKMEVGDGLRYLNKYLNPEYARTMIQSQHTRECIESLVGKLEKMSKDELKDHMGSVRELLRKLLSIQSSPETTNSSKIILGGLVKRLKSSVKNFNI